jgi:hypothetical protein
MVGARGRVPVIGRKVPPLAGRPYNPNHPSQKSLSAEKIILGIAFNV